MLINFYINTLDGLEIVSPILSFNSTGDWRSEVIRLFQVIGSICTFEANNSCGFHVHLSPAGRPWKLEEVQNICIAILYFEPAFGPILPDFRWGNYWAKTFQNENRLLKGKSLLECFTLIKACKTLGQIADLMNPLGYLNVQEDNDRYFSWNFTNLKGTSIGTIEFRQPEGMTTPQGCISWMELATSFVLSARRPIPLERLGGYTCNVDGLEKFVKEGAAEGISKAENLRPIFYKKTGTKGFTDAKKPRLAILQAKQKQDKEKNIMLRKVFLKNQAQEKEKARIAQINAAGGRIR